MRDRVRQRQVRKGQLLRVRIEALRKQGLSVSAIAKAAGVSYAHTKQIVEQFEADRATQEPHQ